MSANYTPNQNEYKNLTPFKSWLLLQINTWGQVNFPFVESDFDELTNYGMMQKLMNAVNDVISNENLVEQDVTNLFGAFTELQSYVNDYLDNLDVQDEINNKLDKMIQDGSFEPLLNNVFQNYYNILQNYVNEEMTTKVDKNGVGQITMQNLSQEVKETMTGGSVAVVGANAVSSYNIANGGIDFIDFSDSAKQGITSHDVREENEIVFEQGQRHVNGTLQSASNTIVSKVPVKVSVGTRFILEDGFTMYIFSYDGGSLDCLEMLTFKAESVQVGSTISTAKLNKNWYIELRNADGTDIVPSAGANAVSMTSVSTTDSLDYVSLGEDLQKYINKENYNIKLIGDWEFGNAVLPNEGGFDVYNIVQTMKTNDNYNRAWFTKPIFLPSGTEIESTDFKFVLIKASTRELTNKEYIPTTWTRSFTIPTDDVYYIAVGSNDNENIYNSLDDISDDIQITLPIKNVSDTMYVSGSGNDSTGNGTSTNPYRQINKALNMGAKTIIVDTGAKYDAITKSNLSNVHIVGKQITYNSSHLEYIRPYFDNSISLNSGTLENGKIKISYNAPENSSLYKGFIEQSEPLEDGTSTRSYGYYATIYVNKGKDSSHRYTPVLSSDDVVGHYYFDGSYLYINPYDGDTISNIYYLSDYDLESSHHLLSLTSCHNVIIENFDFNHSGSSLANFVLSNNIELINCEFKGSNLSDNVAYLNSNGKISNCVSYLARNDGFNFHGFGKTIVENCIGCYCFDDGISHHEQCDSIIIGGEYYGNNKGGISTPTYGAESTIIGTYTHDNTYGIYSVSDSSHEYNTINMSNNLMKSNTIGCIMRRTKGCIFNNKYLTNTTKKNITDSSIIDMD